MKTVRDLLKKRYDAHVAKHGVQPNFLEISYAQWSKYETELTPDVQKTYREIGYDHILLHGQIIPCLPYKGIPIVWKRSSMKKRITL